MRKKVDENYIDFGEWLYKIRKEKGLTEQELVEKINIKGVTERNIRKWERDLEFPEIEVIYNLSEIYMISSAEIIDKKQQTLKNGVESVHKWIIRWISFIMGFSIYGTIWFCRILLTVILILTLIWFYSLGLRSKGMM